MLSFLISILFSLIVCVCVLISIAFFTLIERKILGYIQIRKGPNKVGVVGLPQPLADALKLFLKEQRRPSFSNFIPFFFSPVFRLVLSLLVWIVYPFKGASFYFYLGLIFYLCIISMNVYGTIICGWGSNSKYSLLGALRAVAQTISYEVSLILILLSVVLVFKRYDLYSIEFNFNFLFWIGNIFFPLVFIWLISAIAETNRAPFDFAEGESELVSGFNIEYRSGGFALIFIAEYTSILAISILSVSLFFGGGFFFFYWFYWFCVKVFFLAVFFVWVRGAYPRYRYDLLINLAWKGFLPLSLFYLVFILSFFMLIFFWFCSLFKTLDCRSNDAFS